MKSNINAVVHWTSDLKARNPIIMAPMDTLMATNGFVNDFHIQHYGARAYGGVGTIVVESSAVSPEGKIREKDLGIWSDEHIPGYKRITSLVKTAGALIGLQLNHAGAKNESTTDTKYAPGTKFYAYLEQKNTKLVTPSDTRRIEDDFVKAALRAKKSGFDFVEIHAAHGYLLNEYLNPLLNEVDQSKDILHRGAIVINIARRINEEVKLPVGIRLSVTDHDPRGMVVKDYAPLIKALEKFVFYFNVSSGETISRPNMAEVIKQNGKLYRLPLAKEVKALTKAHVFSGANVSSLADAEAFLANGISGVVVGRELLFNPNFVLTDLLDVEQIKPEDYHWNDNIWFNPYKYLQLMKSLKLK